MENNNAKTVAKISQGSFSQTGKLKDIVLRTSSGMSNINCAVSEVEKIIAQLFNSFNKIGKIVDLITNIAGQAKLLALNASIEAVRAGDQGKGFAAVADEVGKLSEKTQLAVADISKTIEEFQFLMIKQN